MEKPIVVSTTFERQEHAEDVAEALLDARLVACCQIHGPVKSMYWWKDDKAESVEFLLTVKTFEELYTTVESVILLNHPYDVPEIIANPIVQISAEYLDWMKNEVK